MGAAKGVDADRRRSGWGAKVIALLLGLIGLWLAGGGAWLLGLGGSPYYLLAGLLCLASAWFYLKGKLGSAFLCYLALFAGTWIWALAEVGLSFWDLLPRVVAPTVFLALVIVHRLFAAGHSRRIAWGSAAAAAIGFAGFVSWLTLLPEVTGGTASATPTAQADDWEAFGRDAGGSRFSPAAQITPANVGRLQVAWTLRTGDLPAAHPGEMAGRTFEATPLKVGDLVYVCTPHNDIVAVDADTGRERWRYDARLDMKGIALLACRGVAHFRTDAPEGSVCASRLLIGTLDARLIAVDALTGKPCPDFGKNGVVALRDGLGVAPGGFYTVTSPPAIVGGVAVIGGFVLDGIETKEPSGVIRGYDAVTGALRWSWDAGARDENRIPPPGGHYSRGSPNSWSVMSADPELGLVYVPMGNATPDFVGMHRTAEDGRYSSAVVALDAATGLAFPDRPSRSLGL